MQNNSGDKKGKSYKPYFVFLLLVCIPCIGFPVLNYFFPDKPIWTFLFFIFVEFMFLFWLIGQVLRAMEKQKDTKEQAERTKQDLLQSSYDSEEDESHIKVLLAASSLLAVTSFFTTAEGMKQFVFSKSSVALAYLCSLAIQSILFVFGKNLLRFSFSIRYANWSEVLRKILIRGEIIFFCLCLLASSIFSWVYISNNAYNGTKLSDGESAILLFLTDETNKLMAENERQREDNLNKLIQSIKFQISSIVENNLTASQAAAIESIQTYVDAFSPRGYTIPDIQAVNDQIGNLLNLAINDLTDPEGARTAVEANVDQVYNRFKAYDTQYNQMVQRLNGLTQIDKETFDFQQWGVTISSDIGNCKTIYDSIENSFDNAVLNAVQVNGFRLDGNSIVSYLSDFHTLADDANTLRQTLENIQNTLKSASSSPADSTDATAPNPDDSAGSEGLMRVNEIINRIFLLPTQEDAQSKAKELIDQLTNLLNPSSNESTDDMKTIVNVTQQLQKYADNLELQDLLNTFKRDRLGHTYHISDPDSNENNETNSTGESTVPAEQDDTTPTDATTTPTEPDHTAPTDAPATLTESDSHAAITVTSEQWTNERTQDMLDFISYLSLLPNEVSDATDPSHAPDATDVPDVYDSSAVLQEAINLQRRHLGNLTELESAFNYLTSDYPVMSYFSASLALFLDLTAFLTGCLLFFLKALNPPEPKKHRIL